MTCGASENPKGGVGCGGELRSWPMNPRTLTSWRASTTRCCIYMPTKTSQRTWWSGWRWMSLVQRVSERHTCRRCLCQSGRCCSTVGESVAVSGWRWMSRVQTLVDVREGCQSGRCPHTVNSRVRMKVDVTGAVGVTLVWDVREGVSQVDVPAQLMSQKQSGWRCIWTSHL